MTETESIYRVALEGICDLRLDEDRTVEAMNIAREALAEVRRLKREAVKREWAEPAASPWMLNAK